MTEQPFPRNNPPAEVTAERERMVRKRTMQGRSLPQIAAELGITERSVSRIRERIKISAVKPEPLTAAERAKIEDMLDDGCSYREIGRTLGRSENTIWANYPNRSKFEFLGRKHLKLAKMLGLEVIS